MSHFTTIHTQLKDAAALAGACQELGVELLDHAVARGYGSNQHRGDYVIRLRGPYDVALNRQSDGNYAITTDYWGGHGARELGADCSDTSRGFPVTCHPFPRLPWSHDPAARTLAGFTATRGADGHSRGGAAFLLGFD